MLRDRKCKVFCCTFLEDLLEYTEVLSTLSLDPLKFPKLLGSSWVGWTRDSTYCIRLRQQCSCRAHLRVAKRSLLPLIFSERSKDRLMVRRLHEGIRTVLYVFAAECDDVCYHTYIPKSYWRCLGQYGREESKRCHEIIFGRIYCWF